MPGPLIYIIAGEPSGDLLGGKLMAALKERGDARFAGIGGQAMRAQGLDSLFPMAELSVMGLVEVLPRLPRILMRLRQTMADIGARKPDAIVTIDSWGFTGRVQKRARELFPDIPRIHYVAPMVWAWKPNRTKKLAAVLDALMTLLPFEPAWFEKDGLRSVHVGHPVVEGGAEKGDGTAFRARHGIAADAPLLVALPGSRHSEVSRLLPVYAETVALLARATPKMVVAVPTVETVADEVREAVRSWPLPAIVVEGEKFDAFAAGTAGLAASGTVALELALAGLPSVITYKVSPVSAFLAQKFLGFGRNLKWVTLVNILMDTEVMPELLQDACTPERLAAAVGRLLDDAAARDTMRAGMGEATLRLGYGGPSPSARAADAVLAVIEGRKQS